MRKDGAEKHILVWKGVIPFNITHIVTYIRGKKRELYIHKYVYFIVQSEELIKAGE